VLTLSQFWTSASPCLQEKKEEAAREKRRAMGLNSDDEDSDDEFNHNGISLDDLDGGAASYCTGTRHVLSVFVDPRFLVCFDPRFLS